MKLLSWKTGLAGAGLLVIGFIAYNAVYQAGFNAASLAYEYEISEQNEKHRLEKLELEQQLYNDSLTVAKRLNVLSTVFVPVEQEIIKYVSKPNDSGCNHEFVSDWVRLHNLAANPKKHATEAAGEFDDTASGGAKRTTNRGN